MPLRGSATRERHGLLQGGQAHATPMAPSASSSASASSALYEVMRIGAPDNGEMRGGAGVSGQAPQL